MVNSRSLKKHLFFHSESPPAWRDKLQHNGRLVRTTETLPKQKPQEGVFSFGGPNKKEFTPNPARTQALADHTSF